MLILEAMGLCPDSITEKFLEVARTVYEKGRSQVCRADRFALEWLKKTGAGQARETLTAVAMEANSPVARCAAFLVDGKHSVDGRARGWLGLFESLEGYPRAAGEVICRCESFLKSGGAAEVIASKAGNLLAGLLTNGFEQPQTVLTNYNPPYYLDMFLKAGYRVFNRMKTLWFDEHTVRRIDVRIPGFSTRELDLHRSDREAGVFSKLQSSIFTGRDGYVARSMAEDRMMIDAFLPYIDPDLIIIAEDKQANPAGILICIPDVYQKFEQAVIDRARIISIGVAPGPGRNGLGAMMASHLLRNLATKGYKSAEAAWIFESNYLPRNLAKRFNCREGREYALLRKRF